MHALTIDPSAAGAAASSGLLAELPAEIQRIRTLIPLRRLDDTEFVALVKHASVERRAAGKPLFRAGFDEQWLFYLLDGEVEVFDDKGASFHLQGGSLE